MKPAIFVMSLGALLSHLITVCNGQTGKDVVRLHTHLFNSSTYNRRVRPVIDQTRAVEVLIILFIYLFKTVICENYLSKL